MAQESEADKGSGKKRKQEKIATCHAKTQLDKVGLRELGTFYSYIQH